MASTVRDLMKLQGFTHLHLVAGSKGLDKKVSGMGILDYELMPEFIDEFLPTFTPGDFVLCSFLYQYCLHKPEEILPMVRTLCSYGAAGIGFKSILYPELPPEVLEFADRHKLPVFQFGKEIYYENLIYEISDALQTDDRNLLTSENIDSMIRADMPQNRVYTIAKNLSLSFKDHCLTVFLTQESEDFQNNIDRYCKNFYLNRSLGDKAMITPYQNGIFLILTAAKNDKKTFRVILDEILSYLNLTDRKQGFYCCLSRVHKPFESLDRCFKESYNTYLASLAEGKNITDYDKLGVYEILVTDYHSSELGEYMERYLAPFYDRPDYIDTAIALEHAGGDIARAAEIFGCHQNTIRYKLARMREAIRIEHDTEHEFYMNLSLAVRIYQLRQAAKRKGELLR